MIEVKGERREAAFVRVGVKSQNRGGGCIKSLARVLFCAYDESYPTESIK